jgi:hypothetical protein
MLEPTMFDRDLSLMDHDGVVLRKVSIRFSSPYVVKEYGDEGADWSVDVQILALTDANSCKNYQSIQVDSLGALIGALRVVGEIILHSEPYTAGRLYWLEPGDNCGLPEFTGPAYRAPAT